MPAETEIKLAITDVKAFLTKLHRLPVRPAFPGVAAVHEMNILFDSAAKDLMHRGQLLRIRTETPRRTGKLRRKLSASRVILTFKSPPVDDNPNPDARYKIREETELSVSDGAALEKIIESLGFRPWFRYEKLRTTFRMSSRRTWAKGLLIEVDETPVGTFVELEGPGDAIDRVASSLGFSPSDYIQKNYYMVYVEWCRARGIAPGNMLFGEEGGAQMRRKR